MTPRILFSSCLILLAAACVDPYDPPYSDKAVNFLVVDGFLNSGSKSAEIKLSIAVPLASSTVSNPLSKAVVQIEGEDGTRILLPETRSGTYSAASLNVSTGKKYQLRIKTASQEYLSDVVELKLSPVLDSVNWRVASNGISIDVDSHDVSGSTKFYLWTYTETWEYNADMFSQFKWDKGTMTQRRPGDYVFTCYNTFSSTRVLTSSTTSNSLDVVNNFVLTTIPKGSKKVSRLYSILVQQRAIDAQAYSFWKNIQKSTESVGGMFDALPSEVTGNVHNVNNPAERVLGYFSGGEVQEKRIFIDWDEIPLDLHVVEELQCEPDSIRIGNLSLYTNVPLYISHSWGTPATIGYIASTGPCLDCRLTGGVLDKPTFWP
jgi:hypothetical protein